MSELNHFYIGSLSLCLRICTDISVGVTPKVGQNQMCIYNFNIMSSINVILIDTLTNCWLYEHAFRWCKSSGNLTDDRVADSNRF